MNIQIVYGDKRKRSFSIQKNELTIGRDKSNDIVLEDSKVSRQHAQISFDGTQYQVKDLESTNKTFLDGEPLLPNYVYTLEPGKVLRIGRNYLRLFMEEAQAQSAPDLGGQSVPPPPTEQIGLHLENPHLEVEPGGSAVVGITLSNPSERVDHYKIVLKDIPLDWIPTLPPITRLMPHDQQEVSLVIQPPRRSVARAGRHEFSVIAQSQTDPRLVVETLASLNIKPYTQFSCSLAPQKVRCDETARITVQNQGNQLEIFNLTLQDRANDLFFQPPHGRLQVNPGESATLDFAAAIRRRRWLGSPQSHPLNIQVSSLKGELQSLPGEVISRALIPAWAPVAALALLALLVIVVTTFLKPKISTPAFDPQHPQPDQPVTLRWAVQNAQELSLKPLTENSIVLRPEDTQYVFKTGFSSSTSVTISAANFLGKVEETINLELSVPEVSIERFDVSPSEVVLGQPVTITWKVLNIKEVNITDLGTLPPAGEKTFTPPSAGTLTITITAGTKTLPRQVTVKEKVFPLPVVTSFKVTPERIVKGINEKITFSWKTTGAETVVISPWVGPSPASIESIDFDGLPDTSFTFSLVASGLGGSSAPSTAELKVEEPQCTILNDGGIAMKAGPGQVYGPNGQLSKNSTVIVLGYVPIGIPAYAWFNVQEFNSSRQGWIPLDEVFMNIAQCNFNKNTDLNKLPEVTSIPDKPTPILNPAYFIFTDRSMSSPKAVTTLDGRTVGNIQFVFGTPLVDKGITYYPDLKINFQGVIDIYTNPIMLGNSITFQAVDLYSKGVNLKNTTQAGAIFYKVTINKIGDLNWDESQPYWQAGTLELKIDVSLAPSN